MNSKSLPFDTIPLEILENSISMLSMNDIINLKLTSKKLYQKVRLLTDYLFKKVKDHSVYSYERLYRKGLSFQSFSFKFAENITRKEFEDAFERKVIRIEDIVYYYQTGIHFDVFCDIFEKSENSRALLEVVLKHTAIDAQVGNCFGLRYSCKIGYYDIVDYLLDSNRVDPTVEDSFPIRIAAREGNRKIVARLLGDGRADPSAYQNEAIRYSAESGLADIVELLLTDQRVDPTANNNEAITTAAMHGHLPVVQLLLADPRVDPSVLNNAAARWAAEFGHEDVVKTLLADKRTKTSPIFKATVRAVIRNFQSEQDEYCLKRKSKSKHRKTKRRHLNL